MKRLPLIALTAAILCMAAACTHREVSEYYDIPAYGWAYDDALRYGCLQADSDSDSVCISDLAVAIRHANTYEYANLWLELQYHTPDSLHIDTLNLRLADDFGHWQGNGVGVACQYVDTVLKKTPIVTTHPVTLRHIMRVDTLQGIEQAGIILKY